MKRKIFINNDDIPAAQNPRDFEELLKEYQDISGVSDSKSFWNAKTISWTAALAAASILLVFILSTNDNSIITAELDPSVKTEISQKKLDLSSFLEPSFQTKIAPSEETMIVTPSGVIMHFKENSFKGISAEAKDSISITLHQYDDPASIILSEIPMRYDSAGVSYHFQSDGMFNLQASLAGTPVELEKNVELYYPQTTGRTNSSTYFLNDNKWSYLETSAMLSKEEVCEKTIYRFNEDQNAPVEFAVNSELEKIKEKEIELQTQIQNINNSEPLEPLRQNFDNYRFNLDVDPNEFPELSSFENVIFEVKDARFSHHIYDQVWNDIQVKKSPKEGRYLITLKNKQRVEIFDVYPVLSEEEFAKAFSKYSEEIISLEKKRKNLKYLLKENRAYEAEFMAGLEENRAVQREMGEKRKLINQLKTGLRESIMYRGISLSQLGTVNFDLGIPLPPLGFPVIASFHVVQSSIPVKGVSLINIEDNIYYSFTESEFREFRYIKNKKHKLVSILPDGTLTVYRSDLRDEKIKRNEPFRFHLEKVPSENLNEIREFLGLKEENLTAA